MKLDNSQLKRAYNWLRKMQVTGKRPGNPHAGICSNLRHHLRNQTSPLYSPPLHKLARRIGWLSRTWEHYSGDKMYPIRTTSVKQTAQCAYEGRDWKWDDTDEYCRRRRDLCRHLADKIGAHLTKKGVSL